MKLSAILEPLIAAGVPGDVILATVKAFEEQQGSVVEKGREKARARWHRWNDKLLLNRSEWRNRRNFVLSRDNYTCVYCGSQDNLHVDHAIPLTHGGSSDVDNLVTACRECNCGKCGRTVEEWRGGE